MGPERRVWRLQRLVLRVVCGLQGDAQPGILGILVIFVMRHRQGARTHIFVYLHGIRVLGRGRI